MVKQLLSRTDAPSSGQAEPQAVPDHIDCVRISELEVLGQPITRKRRVRSVDAASSTYKMNRVFRSMTTFPDLERVWDGVHLSFCYDSHLLASL